VEAWCGGGSTFTEKTGVERQHKSRDRYGTSRKVWKKNGKQLERGRVLGEEVLTANFLPEKKGGRVLFKTECERGKEKNCFLSSSSSGTEERNFHGGKTRLKPMTPEERENCPSVFMSGARSGWN